MKTVVKMDTLLVVLLAVYSAQGQGILDGSPYPPLGSTSLGGTSSAGSSLIGSSLASLGGSASAGSQLGGSLLGGSTLGGSSLTGSSLGGSLLGGRPVAASSLTGNPLGGSLLGGRPVAGGILTGGSLGGSLLGGSTLGSSGLTGSSLGGGLLGSSSSGSLDSALSSFYGLGSSNSLPSLGSGSLLGGGSLFDNCDEDCEDRNPICSRSADKCNKGLEQILFRSNCPRTCKLCTPCKAYQKKCVSDGTCKDQHALCALYFAPLKCEDSTIGLSVRKMCPVSCRECVPCKVPPRIEPLKCSSECKDLRDDCPALAKQKKYCFSSTYGPWMEENCQLSCGRCKKCIAPPVVPGYSAANTEGSSLSGPLSADLEEIYRNLTSGNSISESKRQNLVKNNPSTQRKVPQECSKGRVDSSDWQQRCVDAHNYYRCLQNAPPLQYSEALAKSAKKYAKKMATDGKPGTESIEPSVPGVDRDYNVGENLAWQRMRNNDYNYDRAIAAWYTEALLYDIDNPVISSKTKHFTQVVWKDTVAVGCGFHRHQNEIYIVAHYQTTGNTPGKYKENVLPAKKEVCNAKCSMGSCQGNDGNQSQCRCFSRFFYRQSQPTCSGNCVAYCPKPSNYRGFWLERCDGKTSCTCSSYAQGSWPGAICS